MWQIRQDVGIPELDVQGMLMEKENKHYKERIAEVSTEKENWKQRYIGLLISGLEAHEIEEYVDELECLD